MNVCDDNRTQSSTTFLSVTFSSISLFFDDRKKKNVIFYFLLRNTIYVNTYALVEFNLTGTMYRCTLYTFFKIFFLIIAMGLVFTCGSTRPPSTPYTRTSLKR